MGRGLWSVYEPLDEEVSPDEPLVEEADDEDGADEGEDREDVEEEGESPEDAEDFVAPESWVLDLASEDFGSDEAVLAAGFSASIAFFLDSDG
jgi:hypothetical protein